LRFYYRTTFQTLHVQNGELASLPLPALNLENKQERAAHDRLAALVDQVIEAERQRMTAVTESDRSYYDSRCRTLDERIDRLVYELYGISQDECDLVEAALG
jgi:hypothetical protein